MKGEYPMPRRIRTAFRRWAWRHVKNWPEVASEMTMISIQGVYVKNGSVQVTPGAFQITFRDVYVAGEDPRRPPPAPRPLPPDIAQ